MIRGTRDRKLDKIVLRALEACVNSGDYNNVAFSAVPPVLDVLNIARRESKERERQ